MKPPGAHRMRRKRAKTVSNRRTIGNLERRLESARVTQSYELAMIAVVLDDDENEPFSDLKSESEQIVPSRT